MHLIESYATSCGLKIDKPYCSSKFFPLNIDKYITFHPFTKEAKNLEQEKKIILIEALWSIIYSDEQADIYEPNLMRRVTGLIYLDDKIVGKTKVKVLSDKK